MNDTPIGLPLAAPWSLWAGTLGKDLVFAGLVFFALSAALWLLPKRPLWIERAAKLGFTLGGLTLFGAMACLVALFVRDQFQYAYVYEHAGKDTTLPYKVASAWTFQQGSFLLWGCTSALFALIAVRNTGRYRRWFTVATSLFLGTLCGILAYETPFNILPQTVAHGKTFVPLDGAGMTPSLQNYWVIIHPPTIFLGFGILSVLFAYAVAAMLEGDADEWVPRVRPYTLLATGILGLGISMGGLWAYETQGWGGFWAWDPVENVSFVPWIFVVALAHGLIVQVARGKWKVTNLLLGGLPFLIFVYGTFLTRSGLLDKASNHSFATMDDHARGILRWFLIVLTAAFLTLWASRGRSLAPRTPVEPDAVGTSREGLYRSGVLTLCLAGVVIALGMSWPVIEAARGGQGSKVEEWLYHLVMVWFFIPIMLLMAVAPFASWRNLGWKTLGNRVFAVACVALGLTGFAQMALMSPFGVHAVAGETVAAPFGFHVPLIGWMFLLLFLCVFVAVANVWRATEIARRSPGGVGGFVAHLGFAVLIGGLILSRGYEQKETIYLRKGSPATALGYTITYKDWTNDEARQREGEAYRFDPYDRGNKVILDVQAPDGSHFEARPALYQYGEESDEPQMNIWPHIQRYASHDVYLAMAKPQIKVWDAPITFKPGEVKDFDGMTVEYVKPEFKGQAGMAGFQMGAQLRFTIADASGERHQYLATPSLRIAEGQPDYSMPEVGKDFRVAMPMMSPKDRSAEVMLFFSPPVYPITLFYKPLTGLIWLGTGILTLGGVMAAAARRVRVSRPQRVTNPTNDAPLPAA